MLSLGDEPWRIAPRRAGTRTSYLRITDLHVGLLTIFGAPTMKEGIERVVTDPPFSIPPRLSVRHED